MDATITGAEIVEAGLTGSEHAEFLDAVAMGFCPECGKEISQNPRGRRKKFCSDTCRFAWKHKHPKPENWKMVTLVCPICGTVFQARGCRDATRKYCSRSCANHGRALERRMLIGTDKE